MRREDLHREVGLFEALRELAIESLERLGAVLGGDLLGARDHRVALAQQRFDLRQRAVDARGEILTVRASPSRTTRTSSR